MNSRLVHVVFLLLVGAATCLPQLNRTYDVDGREARHAEIAREMVLTGQYAVPPLLGRPFEEKPPLFNWTAAAFFKLSGRVNLALARLPSVISAIAIASMLYFLGRRWYGVRAGLWAGLMWLTFPLVVVWSRLSRADMMLAGLILGAISLAVLSADARSRGSGRLFWGAASLVTGAAIITKGPQAAFFFAVAVAAIWRAHRGRFAPPWTYVLAALLLLAVAPTVWLVACETSDPGHTKGLVSYQFGTGITEHLRRIWMYMDQLPVWTMPWALFSVGGARTTYRRFRREGYGREFIAPLVLAVALLALTFFPNKRSHYLLPVLPLWALWLAAVLDRACRRFEGVADEAGSGEPITRADRWLYPRVLMSILTIGILGGVSLPLAWLAGAFSVTPDMAALGMLIAALALYGLFCLRRGRMSLAVWTTMAVCLIAVTATYPVVRRHYASPDANAVAARSLREVIPPNARLAGYEIPSEEFYFLLNRDVEFLHSETELLQYAAGPGPRYLLLPSQLAAPMLQHATLDWRVDTTLPLRKSDVTVLVLDD